MDLVASLSPALWGLLQRTRLRPDLALELFDGALTPQLPASEDLRSVALRGAASIRSFAGAEVSFRTVLQSGRDARVSIDDWDLTLLPIRESRQPVGLLAAATPRQTDLPSAEWVGPAPGEAAAHAWRDAIEGDLVSTRRLRAQEQLTHRARALATFVADLQQRSDERELLNALLQAIAVWYDVEACAYSRDLAGYFVLRGTLPGTDVSALPTSLEAGAVIDATARCAGEWPVAAQLGWRGDGTPLLMLVSSGSLEEWLIAVSGSQESNLSEELQPVLRGFFAGLERVREREARNLLQQLLGTMVAWSNRSDLRGLGSELLNIIGRTVDATHGVLTVCDEAEPPASAGAPVPADTNSSNRVHDGYFSADALRISFPVGSGRVASMELRRTDGAAFRSANVTAVLAVRPLIGAWLYSVGDAGEWNASSGSQDSPRVLRFTDSGTSAWT